MQKQLDFVIVGGQKCGTTSLAGQLAELPEIVFCQEKEPHFFSKTVSLNEAALNEYFNLFNGDGLLGEASTTYSFIDEYPETPKRLYEHNPKMKIVFMLRDPVARIESHFNHRLRNGTVKNSPLEAVGNHACFIERSRYAKQLQAYRQYFSDEQIKVVFFEDFIRTPFDILTTTCQFLGIKVPDVSQVNLQAQNVSDASLKFSRQPILKFLFKQVEKLPFAYRFSRWLPIKVRFDSALKRLLWLSIQDDVAELELLLGVSCQRWRKKYDFNKNERIQ